MRNTHCSRKLFISWGQRWPCRPRLRSPWPIVAPRSPAWPTGRLQLEPFSWSDAPHRSSLNKSNWMNKKWRHWWDRPTEILMKILVKVSVLFLSPDSDLPVAEGGYCGDTGWDGNVLLEVVEQCTTHYVSGWSGQRHFQVVVLLLNNWVRNWYLKKLIETSSMIARYLVHSSFVSVQAIR